MTDLEPVVVAEPHEPRAMEHSAAPSTPPGTVHHDGDDISTMATEHVSNAETSVDGTGTASTDARNRVHSITQITSIEEMESGDGPMSPFKQRMTYGAFRTLRLSAAPKQVALEWSNIKLQAQMEKSKVHKGDPTIFEEKGKLYKAILRGVTGFVRPGEMLAIMGASGAGKSSLLNVLARRNCKNSGSVTVNGEPLTQAYSSIMSCIQQEDIFFGNLTVQQHLHYQALLRKGNHDPKENTTFIEELVTKMGLRKARNNKIGSIQQGLSRGISGGERKRLSVASEILTNPSLLFVDEPTTGLDAYMAEDVMRTLRAIASSGRTVLSTLHQPSSDVWALFDRVCLMCDGRVAFFGDRDEAVVHFSRLGYQCPEYSNPPDFLIKVLALMPAETSTQIAYDTAVAVERQRLDDVCAAWHARVSEEHCDTLPAEEHEAWVQQAFKPPSRYSVSWWQQLRILTGRALIYELKDPLLVKARSFQTIFLAALAGLIYFRLDYSQQNVQDRNGAIFFMMMNQSMNGLFTVLRTFPFERPVFQREYEDGAYSVSAYYLSKLIASFVPQVFFPALFTTIAYWMMNLRDDVVTWLWCMLIVVLVAQCAASFGYVISLLTSSLTVAMATAQSLMIPLLAFAGLFINLDSIPVYLIWLEYISWFKYGYSALTGVIWDGLKLDCPAPPERCPFPTGNSVLDYLSIKTSDRVRDFVFLAGCIVVLRFIAFLLLWWRAQKKQNE